MAQGIQSSGDKLAELRERLRQAEERAAAAEDLLRAIRTGEVDALVVDGGGSPAVYTLKSASEPYQLLIEQMSEGALTVADDGVILYCNSAFAGIVGRERQSLLGTPLRDLIITKRPASGTAELLQQGHAQHEIELMTPQGALPALLSSVRLSLNGEMVHCVVVSDVSRLGIRLLHEAIIDSSADGIYAIDENGMIQSWNAGAERLSGYAAAEVLGRSVEMLMVPDRIELGWKHLRQALLERQRCSLDGLILTKSGGQVDVSVSLSPIQSPDGQITGVSVIARDITERKQAERKVQLLMREINHRSKNLLAVVQAIAHLSVTGKNPAEFSESFARRIAALASCHDLLVHSGWEGVGMTELVQEQIGFFDDGSGARFLVSGPQVRLTPAAAQAIGMALHELCTNAIKYGALSAPEGRVRITWEGHGSPFRLLWREECGPPVRQPKTRGFGSSLIERALKVEAGANAQLEFLPDGVRCEIAMPNAVIANKQRWN